MAQKGLKWLEMTPNSSKWVQITPNGSKWLKTALKKKTPNGWNLLEMAPKVLHQSNKKAKRCQKGAIKVFV